MQLTAILLLSGLVSLAMSGYRDKENKKPLLELEPVSHVSKSAGQEISGLAKSYRHEDVYWAVNDSGNPAAIVPLSPEGKVVSASGRSITIPKAHNIDWEALAADSSGRLYICDVGNNFSRRKQLQVYIIPEPSLFSSSTPEPEIIRIRYPYQDTSGSGKLLYDCEAAFVFNEKLYLLTKRLHDAATSLYRLDTRKRNTVNNLTFMKTYPIKGYVTGADVSPDQKTLAVLTYRALWLFHDFPNDDFFDGRKTKIPLKGAGQIESIVFTSAKHLLLINETNNEIFSIRLNIE